MQTFWTDGQKQQPFLPISSVTDEFDSLEVTLQRFPSGWCECLRGFSLQRGQRQIRLSNGDLTYNTYIRS